MGCGVSRLDDNGVVIPVKARPLFLLRLEEFKRRRHPHALKNNTPSKKELLLENREDQDENASTKPPLFNKAGKDTSLPDETGSCVTSEGSKGGSPDRPMKDDSDKEDGGKKDGNSKEEIKGKFEENEGRTIEPLAKLGEAKVEHVMDGGVKNDEEEADDEDHDEEEEEDDGDDDDDDDGRKLRHHEGDLGFPGSPSFRVYFVDNKKDNKSEGLDDHLTDMAPLDDDPIPSKVPVAKEVKKGKKRRSFKNVLPTSKQAKNLFNVRACISSHSSHDRTQLLSAKAHA